MAPVADRVMSLRAGRISRVPASINALVISSRIRHRCFTAALLLCWFLISPHAVLAQDDGARERLLELQTRHEHQTCADRVGISIPDEVTFDEVDDSLRINGFSSPIFQEYWACSGPTGDGDPVGRALAARCWGTLPREEDSYYGREGEATSWLSCAVIATRAASADSIVEVSSKDMELVCFDRVVRADDSIGGLAPSNYRATNADPMQFVGDTATGLFAFYRGPVSEGMFMGCYLYWIEADLGIYVLNEFYGIQLLWERDISRMEPGDIR